MRVVANGNKPVALWSVPRSISTAFERVFVERDDFEVLHEPFSDAYYYGEDRLSDRYADVEPEAVNNYENVLARVLSLAIPPAKVSSKICGRAWKPGCTRRKTPSSTAPSPPRRAPK